MLRLGGSLLQGRVPATGIVRTLQVGENPTRLAQGIAEFGRIDKTLHSLRFIDEKDMRRSTLTQLNRGEVGTVLHASFSAECSKSTRPDLQAADQLHRAPGP